jgi:hypothetical protein
MAEIHRRTSAIDHTDVMPSADALILGRIQFHNEFAMYDLMRNLMANAEALPERTKRLAERKVVEPVIKGMKRKPKRLHRGLR